MGHAIQNSKALLTALQDNDRTIEMVHFCVGRYNTTKDEKGDNCAILIGNTSLLLHQVNVHIINISRNRNRAGVRDNLPC